MPSFWGIVNRVIKDSDVLLLLLDARLVEETRNLEIESKVKRMEKPLIYVITKCDLIGMEEAEKWKKKLSPCVFVSAKEKLGTTILRNTIIMEAKRAGLKEHKITVGVLGYPNVGKSSLINAIKGRNAAPTSSMSGFTRGLQKIKADNRIMMLDTPGVIPYEEKDNIKHAAIGTIDFTKAKDPDMVVFDLMKKLPGKIEAHYKVNINEEGDFEETLSAIAIKKNILKKGAVPDLVRCAREILKDWQKGLIK